MKKGCLLIISAMMLLAPVGAFSCPSATDTTEGHGSIHGSMTDTHSDKRVGQPLSDIKEMKSDQTTEKPMADVQQETMMQSK
jgi:hypothetical protein